MMGGNCHGQQLANHMSDIARVTAASSCHRRRGSLTHLGVDVLRVQLSTLFLLLGRYVPILGVEAGKGKQRHVST